MTGRATLEWLFTVLNLDFGHRFPTLQFQGPLGWKDENPLVFRLAALFAHR